MSEENNTPTPRPASEGNDAIRLLHEETFYGRPVQVLEVDGEAVIPLEDIAVAIDVPIEDLQEIIRNNPKEFARKTRAFSTRGP